MPPKFFTNEKLIGPPKNAWKPTGQAPQYKPTSVSVSIHNTFIQNKNENTRPKQLPCIEGNYITLDLDAPQYDKSFENINSKNFHTNYPNYITIYSPSWSDQNETEISHYYNSTNL